MAKSPRNGKTSFGVHSDVATSSMNENTKIRAAKNAASNVCPLQVIVFRCPTTRCDRQLVIMKLGFLSSTYFFYPTIIAEDGAWCSIPNCLWSNWFWWGIVEKVFMSSTKMEMFVHRIFIVCGNSVGKIVISKNQKNQWSKLEQNPAIIENGT